LGVKIKKDRPAATSLPKIPSKGYPNMDNDIRILIGLTDLNVEFDPKAEQHFNETNLNGTATITWNLLLTYATNCEKCGTPMVHNGTKMVTHKGPRSAFKFQNYRMRKKKSYARNVDTRLLRTSATFNQTTISSIRLNKPQQWN